MKNIKKLILLITILVVFSVINVNASTEIVTWDTSKNGTNYTLSNDNLTSEIFGNGSRNVIANVGKQTGKWYWEIKIDDISNTNVRLGIGINDTTTYDDSILYAHNGYIFINNNAEVYGSSFIDNVIGIALDLDTGKIEFYKDGISQGIIETGIDTSNTYYPKVYNGDTTKSATITANFGATAFVHQIPSGYHPYNATVVQPNIPTNLIAAPSNNNITLDWDAVTDADNYTILRSTDSGTIDTVIASNMTTTTYTDINVTPGTTYYYVVRAVKNSVESADSNVASAMVENNIATLQIKLSTTDIYEYTVTMSDVSNFIKWYTDRANNIGLPFYIFPDSSSIEPYTKINEYIIHDKIVWFKVKEYLK
ncbi:hypothetical protein HZI73_15620 [Vallitalea pronyensis]|uniref:Fibronectin type-III domain-containing protein n=1 Tax=Vallitalea pronyensis TaxID=1348613 RepID=A0A8J8MKW9_9FIRM|nr:SPRY domain-containing protein [Vallitalea pronyensis]QUI23630.1 hypothetical protein HZI73_15620 [Vallitalea pronyensis]